MKIIFVIFLFSFAITYSQEKNIKLPDVKFLDSKSLYDCLKLRHSSREFASKDIPLQAISDMLWAAGGINRKESGKKTAPSAMNYQEIDVYLILKTGAYLYSAIDNSLQLITGQDLRKQAGTQDFVWEAPVNLIYVADLSKLTKTSNEEARLTYIGADAGFMAQNVYLFCESQGFETVVRASIPVKELSAALKLNNNQKIILSQTVGYSK